MSNIGKGDRQLWYMKNCPELGERFNGPTLLKFIIGDITESLLVFLAQLTPLKVTALQDEVVLDGIRGHIDLDVDGVTVDVKSASPYSFKKFQNGTLADNDAFGYIEQISGYSKARGTSGAFLAMDKVAGTLAYLPFTEEELGVFKVEDRIKFLKEAIESKEPPERCYSDEEMGESGNRKLGVNCSYCVDPSVKIFKADLTWESAQDIKVGDALVGFNKPTFAPKLTNNLVTHIREFEIPRVKVTTTEGSIIVSSDHLFVASTSNSNLIKWRRADTLKPGNRIKYFGKPWEIDNSNEAQYLRGFLDGEGHFGIHKLSWAQNPGPVLDYVNDLMINKGYVHHHRYVKNNAGCIGVRLQGSFYDTYKALGTIRPIRLLPKAIKLINGLQARSYKRQQPTVLNIEHIGIGKVIAITTSDETLITDGYFSHNCAFKDECWSDANGGVGLRQFQYSTGPVWLTEVKKEPKVWERTKF